MKRFVALSFVAILFTTIVCAGFAFASEMVCSSGCGHGNMEQTDARTVYLPYGNGHRLASEYALVCKDCGFSTGPFYVYKSETLSHTAGGTGNAHLSSTDQHMFYRICKECNAHYDIVYKDCFADTTGVHVSHSY